MHKYIIMGAQGCGKGTQSLLLKQTFDLVHISVGDIFRSQIESRTKLGARIRRFVNDGQLVPDEIVEEIVRRRLDEHDWNYGFILDGFPRNRPQAVFFLENYDVDAVIYIEVPHDVVLRRLLSRRLCSQCGLDYNLIFHRPTVAGVCDVCGGELVQRADDTEKAVAARLKDFYAKTEPILELFRQKELVITVDGTQSQQEVHQEVCTRLTRSHARSGPANP
ncbi:MAG: nucleoside monophosphate kinase [Planctomycetaceae bacterium]|nr:nucleoside monophosphate kinase [Planctomycetaceae bacterium]